MNLIEQLGGYERAKDGLHRLKLEKKDLLTCGDLVVVESEIDAALLEYRRQHNIFEVGDKVVFSNNPCALNHSVWQVISNKDYPVVAPICNFNGRVIVEANMSVLSPYRIQHAEDEEIKAGKRLEVNNGY